MTFAQFSQELDGKLSFLPPKKKEQTLTKYRRLFEDARQLGVEEASFVAGLGSTDAIVEKLRTEQGEPNKASTLNTELRKGAVYLLAGVIAIAMGFLCFMLFSFGFTYFIYAITKLIQNAGTSQAAYALYIGQMLIGAGIWVVLIGYLSKGKRHFSCLVNKLSGAINQGGRRDE